MHDNAHHPFTWVAPIFCQFSTALGGLALGWAGEPCLITVEPAPTGCGAPLGAISRVPLLLFSGPRPGRGVLVLGFAYRSSYAFGVGGLVESKALLLVLCDGPHRTSPLRCVLTLVGDRRAASVSAQGDLRARTTCLLTQRYLGLLARPRHR